MRYVYEPFDGVHFAANLRRNEETNRLEWKCSQGQETLVVQTPFDVEATGIMERIVAALEGRGEPLGNDYVEILAGVFARAFPPAELAHGCPLNGEACRYTVFALERSADGTWCIYAPSGAMASPTCEVPLDFGVSVEQEKRLEGLFRKKEVPSGYYRIAFDRAPGATYVGGDIRYRIGEDEIPLTRSAIERREVYVRSREFPEVISRNPGIRVVDYRTRR